MSVLERIVPQCWYTTARRSRSRAPEKRPVLLATFGTVFAVSALQRFIILAPHKQRNLLQQRLAWQYSYVDFSHCGA